MKRSVCPVGASSQFLQFQFSVGLDSTAIFGHKVTRNLSKLKKAEKVQSVLNQTCAVFNSFFKTLHFWFIYIFDFKAWSVKPRWQKIFKSVISKLTEFLFRIPSKFYQISNTRCVKFWKSHEGQHMSGPDRSF